MKKIDEHKKKLKTEKQVLIYKKNHAQKKKNLKKNLVKKNQAIFLC